MFCHHLVETQNPRKLASPTHEAQDAPSCHSLFKMHSAACIVLLRITATLMYNLRRLSCKPQKIISDQKEIRPFQTKLNLSPRTGARTEVRLFSPDLCRQNSQAKPPLLAFKTRVCESIIGSFLPASALGRESLSISKCHVKCFSCPVLTQEQGAI